MQTKYFRLKDIADKVDLTEVVQARYKVKGAYARVKDGVLVIVGDTKLTYAAISELINLFFEKLRKQKKKLPETTKVFWYAA